MRHQAQVLAGLLIDLVTRSPLHVQHAGKQILAHVHGDHPAHHAPDFGIEKWRYQLPDKGLAGHVIGVEQEHDFRLHEILHGFLQRGGFPRLSAPAMERGNSPRITGGNRVDNGFRSVRGAIVNGNDMQAVGRIIHVQQALEDIGDDRLLVVGGDQNGHRRPLGNLDVDERIPLPAEEAVQRKAIMPHHVDDNAYLDQTERNQQSCRTVSHCPQPPPRLPALRCM